MGWPVRKRTPARYRISSGITALHQGHGGGLSRNGEFERAIGPHLRPAYNLARWLVRDDRDAEDILQEATVRALRHFDSFRGLNPRAWFMAIVRNACWSHLSRKRPPDEVFDEERDTPAVLQLQ